MEQLKNRKSLKDLTRRHLVERILCNATL